MDVEKEVPKITTANKGYKLLNIHSKWIYYAIDNENNEIDIHTKES